MSDELERQTLSLVARLIHISPEEAMLVQRLWKDRSALIKSARLLQDWDLGHAEALSLPRVQQIIQAALAAVGEE